MKTISYSPIGIIHSPFRSGEDVPIQSAYAEDVAGTVELFPEYLDGLKDLGQFSHLILIYHFHLSRGYELEVKPFLDEQSHGVFATRAPRRPNHIGISTVRLNSIEGSVLHVAGVDIVDGTPLLDIKPYIPDYDDRAGVRVGWLEGKREQAKTRRADDRFSK
jgi:tRNA-Thr(GGU) m(6)t(6)A37 methyltransferase TsaA